MAQSKNPVLKVAFAVAMLGLAVVAAIAIVKNTGRPQAPASPAPAAQGLPPPTPAGAQSGTPAAGQASGQGAAAAPAPGAPAGTAGPGAAPAAVTTGWAARVWKDEALASVYDPLGALGPDSPFEMKIEFAPLGAGVRSLRLTHHFDDIKDAEHTEIQRAVESQNQVLVPLAALWIDVNGTVVPLAGAGVWKQRAGEPGVFDAEVLDSGGAAALKITRRFELVPGTYRFTLRQTITNVSGTAVATRFHQYGPVDLPGETTAYGGDRRRLRFGYLLNPTADPTRRAVVSGEFVQDHQVALGSPDRATGLYPLDSALWPNPRSTEAGYELAWAGLTSRYFGVVVLPAGDPASAPTRALAGIRGVDRVVWNRYKAKPDGTQALDPMMALRLNGAEATIAPGATAELGVGVYAGPLSRPLLNQDAVTKAYGLTGLVLFNMYTTAQWWCCCAWGPVGAVVEGIAGVLFALMHFLHDFLVRDWSLAIVLLVVCVRTVLHPLTKWSQVRMQRFAKQMQGMAPKQKQIQERYRDDKKRLQEEMAKLWREEEVSPLGMIGCAPMVLVTPIWIGLYAMLYFAFELRHSPAFFGAVQALAPGWTFLADLSEPDRIYSFGRVLATLPIIGPVSSVNVLPLILGAVFFVHQKYLTPPSTGPMTPEQEMQQKMVKVMSVVMFPLFMYNAPCGLAIYFITNSTLAIFENKYIRAHIDKHDLLTPKKKGGAPDGFVARVLKAAEDRARAVEKSRTQPRRKG